MNNPARVLPLHGEAQEQVFPKYSNLRLEALKASISTMNAFSPVSASTDEIASAVIDLARKYEPYLQGQ